MEQRRITLKVDLPGGQDRLKQMILYVAQQCQSAERFGGIKLNKILWRADFESYASRSVPVTGRAYQRLRLGPAPKEMVPVRREMIETATIRIETVDFGNDVIEQRVIACVEPDLHWFSELDLQYVNASIGYYWNRTGMEASDDSHGAAWKTRSDQEAMPYEAALLSDHRPGAVQITRVRQLIADRGLLSE